MKKQIYLIMTFVMLSFVAFTSNAATTDKGVNYKEYYATKTAEERNARVEEIKTRVEEIRSMDKSQLSKAERKALKAELKDLKKEANAASTGGGVYLSVGAIIIIILVLILIL
jgi:alpha-galactosidase/6-phospho-beta-glucosidase family protein